MNQSLPWYREPWPWILMSGPAAVIVAGVITTWIAFATADPLVVQDYYRRGLTINARLACEQAAAAAGAEAARAVASCRDKAMMPARRGQ
jgi:uncharacterized protein